MFSFMPPLSLLCAKKSILSIRPYRRNFSLYPGFQIVIGSSERNRRKAPFPLDYDDGEATRLKESGSNRVRARTMLEVRQISWVYIISYFFAS